MQLRKETCIGCECELQYTKSIPTKQMGVMMHMGERFCTGGKRARKFKRSDPKIYVPDWCPKRKKPCELRVYCFKNKNEWRLHEILCHDLGMDISPDSWRYAPLYELHTDLAPQEFAKICNDAPDAETLHVAVHRHYVVVTDWENERNTITWIDSQNNIQFSIDGNLDRDDILHIAESVSLAKREN